MFIPFLTKFLQLRFFKYQIKVFLNWREKQGIGSYEYEDWLLKFLNKTDKSNVLDINIQDVENFLQYVSETTNGKWPLYQAEKCIRQFIKFYSARGKLSGTAADYQEMRYFSGVSMLSNIKRNRDLVVRRLKDPEKWSWRRLGDYYNIHYTTAKQIFKRDARRYATGEEIKNIDLPIPSLRNNKAVSEVLESRNKTIFELSSLNISIGVIAKQFNMTRQRVHQIVNKYRGRGDDELSTVGR